MKALHCYQPVERRCKVVSLLASMCTYEILYNVKDTTDSAAEHSDEDVVTDKQVGKPVRQVVGILIVIVLVVAVLLLLHNYTLCRCVHKETQPC